jgi:hypothetical protein
VDHRSLGELRRGPGALGSIAEHRLLPTPAYPSPAGAVIQSSLVVSIRQQPGRDYAAHSGPDNTVTGPST